MSIIAQIYLRKALRSSEVGLYFVVKLGRETSLTNETLHTCLSKCVEDSNDLSFAIFLCPGADNYENRIVTV